jgi:hypothetical protein
MAKDPVLDREILRLSENDTVRFRDIIEGGCLITGGLGSGKSSTSARNIALSFLSAGFGGLVLTVKSDETEHWIEYAKQTGREKDLVVFNAASGLSFDPLAYVWNAGGRAAAQIETIVELFTVLMAVGKVYQPSSGERYFEQAVEELLRATLVVLSNAGEPISITAIHRVIASLPIDREQVASKEWQDSSECQRVIEKLKQRRHTFSVSQWDDLDIAIVYLLEKWPSQDTRTRSNVESTWSGMASKFTYSPFRELFCSGRFDFTPEQTTHERKIVLVDMPLLEYGRETARLCQILIKLIFQRAWLRHQYRSGCCNGCFIFQDEFALLMHRHEAHFHMVCRSSAIAPICITPNILNIAAEEFGEQEPGAKTLGFLGLLSMKIFHANNETQTNEYAANQIGREYRYLDNFNGGGSSESNHTHFSTGASRQLVHILEPIEFTRLLKPDGDNPLSESVIYLSGRTFNATRNVNQPRGLPYLRVHFSRE